MSEKDGDFFEGDASNQHLNGEGIAQRVGVSVRKSSSAEDSLQSFPPCLTGCASVAGAAPEKIAWVF